LPAEGFGGIGVFTGKGTREIDLPISICQVLLVKLFNRFNLGFHEGMKGFREEGGAVLLTPMVPDMAHDPIAIGLFGAIGVVVIPQDLSNLIHEPEFRIWSKFF
jgi:hypothetical protein